MNLQKVLSELIRENQNRWRREALEKYETLVRRVKQAAPDFKSSDINYNLPVGENAQEILFKSVDDGNDEDQYVEVSLDRNITVRLRLAFKGAGEVDGFLEFKRKSGKYGVPSNNVLIVLDIYNFPVLRGLVEEGREYVYKFTLNSLTKNTEPWPGKNEILSTFIHEYIEYKKVASGKEDPERSSSDEEGYILSDDEIDARFNEALGWVEHKISTEGQSSIDTKNFEEFKNWFFEKFGNEEPIPTEEISSDQKERLVKRLYKWYDNNIG